MNQERADGLAFFGATGDLAHKKCSRPFKRWSGAAISTFPSSVLPKPVGRVLN